MGWKQKNERQDQEFVIEKLLLPGFELQPRHKTFKKKNGKKNQQPIKLILNRGFSPPTLKPLKEKFEDPY